MISQSFGKTREGEDVTLYRVANSSGAYVEFMNWDCVVKRICVRDNRGELQDVCLGYETLAEYEDGIRALGAIVNLRGQNDNILPAGLVWAVDEVGENFVSFSHSPEPGLTLGVRYMWVDYDRLVIDVSATSETDIPVNLTSNIQFRLDAGNSLEDHSLRLFAEHIIEGDGKLLSASESGFDSESFKSLGGEGYEGLFLSEGDRIRPFAELYSPTSGISLTSYGTAPALSLRVLTDPAAAILSQRFATGEAGVGGQWKQRIVYGFDRYSR